MTLQDDLAAIAAHIWDEGYEAAQGDARIGTQWMDETPNPYRASEDA